MALIFSVEDNPDIQELLQCSLKNFGYELQQFETAEEMLKVLEIIRPDLILLDIMLPGMDGMAALKRLKKGARSKNIPVIMLSAKSGEGSKVACLDAGADDYITKPFSVMELNSRIKANLRKRGAADVLESMGIKLDLRSRAAYLEGRAIHLTLKEFELLKALMAAEGEVLTRESLLSGIWGFDYLGETRTLDMHIKALRGKIKDDAESGTKIVTMRGVGFMWVGEK